MGFKETLNEKPKLAMGLATAFIVGAVLLAFLTGSVGGGDAGGNRPDEAFFTVDDGKTWFADSAGKVAPFDRDGKPAVRAHVFAAGGKQFVNHLERFTPAGKQYAESVAKNPGMPRPTGKALNEVKRPGDATWVSASDKAKAGPILRVTVPPGVTGEAVAVTP